RSLHGEQLATASTPRLAKWVQSIHIPGTMMRFSSLQGASVSLLFVAPLGFATGILAASIAVGGFIGVPAMIYVLGVPALMATASELVVAFVMGMGGSLLYAWEGFVDIRLSMIILAGSLFGIQLGAIGTTYVRDHTVKFVMGMIMLIVLLSRLFKLPVYFSNLGWTPALSSTSHNVLTTLSYAALAVALIAGAGAILSALLKGVAEHRRRTQANTKRLAVD
ncbi:MAG: sulfite exporter TauE/SafE family protein, partial [Gammaproteobacteria bacterium]|nr:sulfite exporter TauE/SafE family protein [Gammaproteobacteria bacterium]